MKALKSRNFELLWSRIVGWYMNVSYAVCVEQENSLLLLHEGNGLRMDIYASYSWEVLNTVLEASFDNT
jgi:hypothetical protein